MRRSDLVGGVLLTVLLGASGLVLAHQRLGNAWLEDTICRALGR
ncbi:hypothetical protein [Rhodovarius crocodyli]|nr:hypothetical protein [Rhodovarius crocodyli]